VSACPRCLTELPFSAVRCVNCGSEPSPFETRPDSASSSSDEEGLPAAWTLPEGEEADWGAGLAPGSVIAGRFRIIERQGRGAMGEVYRADDLKLGQRVALKFLPANLSQDPRALARFHAEVRHARQVSHPNVCRVYDIGEIGGQHFLTMEHIDGEDLASLFRRIGPVPQTKGREIARELALGIAAMHERGVLHRDLKPSNILLDGHGRARIADFGLAAPIEEGIHFGATSGTPAYMAPELQQGLGASVASDLYALGLVLYKLFTGRHPFEADSFSEWKRKHAEEIPEPPSRHMPGLDPVVESLILRCLEKDPRDRPASALEIARAFPGDPLASVVAAGGTPSPAMLRAAPMTGRLKVSAAVPLLAGTLVLLLLYAFVAPVIFLYGWVPLDLTPEVLVEKARETVRSLGYSAPGRDSASGFVPDLKFLSFAAEQDHSAHRWRRLSSGEPPALLFFYRQSPGSLTPLNSLGLVSPQDPPSDVPGMIDVTLDTKGRLRSFLAVAPRIDPPGSRPIAPDWARLLERAEMDRAALTPVEPRSVPPAAFDVRSAWEAANRAGPPLRAEAAAYRGRPIFFHVMSPWEHAVENSGPLPLGWRLRDYAFLALTLIALVGGVLLARRNARLKRGDRSGAWKLALFEFAALALSWAFSTHPVSNATTNWNFTVGGLGRALFWAAFLWLLYMALEPAVRRRWPRILVSWNRFLDGDTRDPLVGRDILVGCFFGIAILILRDLHFIAPSVFHVAAPTPVTLRLDGLTSASGAAAMAFDILYSSIYYAFAALFLFLLLRLALRKPILADPLWIGLVSLLYLDRAESLAVELLLAALVSAVTLFVLVRFGMLAVTACLMMRLLYSVPITLNPSVWYAGRSYLVLLAVTGLAVYGFTAALDRASAPVAAASAKAAA
jgi:Protein kinase domain